MGEKSAALHNGEEKHSTSKLEKLSCNDISASISQGILFGLPIYLFILLPFSYFGLT